MLAGHGIDMIESTLDNLFDSPLEHVQSEESLMDAYHDPTHHLPDNR